MNNTMFIAKSLAFYPGFFQDNCQELSDEIIIPSYYLNRIMEQFQDGEMLYLDMTNVDTNKNILVAIGSPHTYDKNTLFAPQWILDLIDCTGTCNSVIKLKKSNMSDVPAATKIVIKPHDPIAFELDTLACFERALMNIHSIKEGITIPVHIPELGKEYTMFAHIEKVEPASVSRIVAGEVNVEFINEFNDVVPSVSDSETIVNEESLAPMMIPSTGAPDTPPLTNNVNSVQSNMQTISAEERRRIIRDSWTKRYHNIAEWR